MAANVAANHPEINPAGIVSGTCFQSPSGNTSADASAARGSCGRLIRHIAANYAVILFQPLSSARKWRDEGSAGTLDQRKSRVDNGFRINSSPAFLMRVHALCNQYLGFADVIRLGGMHVSESALDYSRDCGTTDMADPFMLSAPDLAALLCSRVCHDIISPVGAINNGLELLDEGGADEDAMNLIRTSARNASARLQFARIAFGAAGSAGMLIDTGDAEAVAIAFLRMRSRSLSGTAGGRCCRRTRSSCCSIWS